jgi:aminocarboxymuconate-semialdehyde decarboxylase
MGSFKKGKRGTTRRDFVKKAAVCAAGVTFSGALRSQEAAPVPAVQAGRSSVSPASKDAAKIDVFAPILPRKYLAAYAKNNKMIAQALARNRAVTDVDYRIKLMDRIPDVLQVLTIARPPQDIYVNPNEAAELARIANDELAELLVKFPNKFASAVACIAMHNIDAALQETDRAITRLGFKGVQVCTRAGGESLDQPQFRPLWEKMARYDLPIWIHPSIFEAPDEDGAVFSWALETSVATCLLVKMGIFNDHPNIKFITHHCAAILPYLEKRPRLAVLGHGSGEESAVHTPEEHFRKFYNGTSGHGNADALMYGYNFFGADHLLFATGAPYSAMNSLTRQTISSVEQMNIPDIDKEKIFARNAADILKLPV